jgi:hypothetical protein
MSWVSTFPLSHISTHSLTYIVVESSDSDDHFSDAQSAPGTGAVSPIPRTRVEKVDDEPSYGEVPGTAAYDKRTKDASPDEIAIVPDEQSLPLSTSQAITPGSTSVPKTVVDETHDVPGSSTHHYHEQSHTADATPDIVRKPDGTAEANPIPASLDVDTQDTGTTTKSS